MFTETISGLDKGVPGETPELRITEVGGQGWNVLREDIPLPVAVIRQDALRQNSRWMRHFIGAKGVTLAPHGKTTMAPAIFDLQIADGAWGITVATPHQAQVAIRLGHKTVFFANQLVGLAAIRQILRQIEADLALDVYCLVDSEANVAQIEAVATALGQSRKLNVLVELGHAGGRTGCRTVEQAVALARRVAISRHLALVGIEGFEAFIRGSDIPSTYAAIETFLRDVAEVAVTCDGEGLFAATSPIILSAGGSAFFDLVADCLRDVALSRPVQVLLRSGCYITHDAGMYTYAFSLLQEREPSLFEHGTPSAALEVLGYVQSRPEPDLALITLGKRDISYDQLPVAERWFRPGGGEARPSALTPDHVFTRLDDQHGYLRIPAQSPLAVGDIVVCGISHPCLTFDKWRVLHVVDEDYTVVESVKTYF